MVEGTCGDTCRETCGAAGRGNVINPACSSSAGQRAPVRVSVSRALCPGTVAGCLVRILGGSWQLFHQTGNLYPHSKIMG